MNPNSRQSTFTRPNRRSTFLSRSSTQNGPIVPNPNNTPEYNEELKSEFEKVKFMNQACESALENINKTKDQLTIFNDTIDRTNGLLDLWMDILKNAEDTKSVLKNPNWSGSSTLMGTELKNKKEKSTKKRRLNE